MRFEKPNCPCCKTHATSTWEIVPGQALLTAPDESGDVDYAGETVMFWDGQTSDENEEGFLLGCDCGESWRSKLLPEKSP
jgi:hypothetical protein